jgi:hypothetical protein
LPNTDKALGSTSTTAKNKLTFFMITGGWKARCRTFYRVCYLLY